MKDVFEELEAEVAQNVVDRKHDAIERKNLLIANDNLITECLSKEVFFVAKNSKLDEARFTEMHVANTIVEARCLALEAELANLRDKSHYDNQEELINCFSKLEVNHLNLQLKYQNLKDSFGNNPPTPDKHTPDFDSVFVIGKMQASLQGKENVIRQLKKQISQLNNRDAHLDYLRHLKESVETIRNIVEEAKGVRPLDRSIVSACRVKRCTNASGSLPRSNTKKNRISLAKGVKRCTNASGSHPRSNTKKNRISLAKGVNKLPVEEQSRTNKCLLRTSNRVDSSSRIKRI
nr:hypothetical protein [Tanacetum cinerariifolium]GFA69481.1 hypothetical protein [Tanacetum cinerariifolium]